ncbi:MAG: sodium:dicarboxylate symporter [Spirochaetaceae bacterium]|nr:sodium:dicarboxylate symporter [Spirochaetaceae bacterium]
MHGTVQSYGRYINLAILASGILGFVFFHYAAPSSSPEAYYTLGFICLIASLWISEIVPLGVASLLPLIYFPLADILDARTLGESYFNSTIFLFLGGFLLAASMEKWDLHKRIALWILSLTGKRIVAGFMLASAFLSMWISNTATAMMMLPIASAVLGRLSGPGWSRPVYLGVAYGCSIGGIATLIGTPPNLAFSRIYKQNFQGFPGFAEWMLLSLPLATALLLIAYLVLDKWLYRAGREDTLNRQHWKEQLIVLGPATTEQKMAGGIFTITALLWIFRSPLDLETFSIPGWIQLFHGLPGQKSLNDGTVALIMALICFALPAPSHKGKRILEARDLDRIPWSILLLFGAGFALAAAFQSSGLSQQAGSLLQSIRPENVFLMILLINFSMNMMTEFTSNTATAQIILPVMAALSAESGLPAFGLMAGVTFSVSMAFMMPVATPPNAIVFGSGQLRIADMVRTGLILNPITALVVSVYCYFMFF